MPEKLVPEGDFVEVHRGRGGPAIAEVVRATLAAEDIPCLIKSESAIVFAPFVDVEALWASSECSFANQTSFAPPNC